MASFPLLFAGHSRANDGEGCERPSHRVCRGSQRDAPTLRCASLTVCLSYASLTRRLSAAPLLLFASLTPLLRADSPRRLSYCWARVDVQAGAASAVLAGGQPFLQGVDLSLYP
eukprot:1180941-Prorocentrum_minimum.AAC.5